MIWPKGIQVGLGPRSIQALPKFSEGYLNGYWLFKLNAQVRAVWLLSDAHYSIATSLKFVAVTTTGFGNV